MVSSLSRPTFLIESFLLTLAGLSDPGWISCGRGHGAAGGLLASAR